MLPPLLRPRSTSAMLSPDHAENLSKAPFAVPGKAAVSASQFEACGERRGGREFMSKPVQD